jgi:hypothetical protein
MAYWIPEGRRRPNSTILILPLWNRPKHLKQRNSWRKRRKCSQINAVWN